MSTAVHAETAAEAHTEKGPEPGRDKSIGHLTFLLVGRTGVGKSSTVNSLLGKPIAPVNDFVPMTTEVKAYPGVVNGVSFSVVDTPGLCDDLEEAGNDERYLKRIEETALSLDSVWFLTPLNETRVTGDEKRAIQMLGRGFGAAFWTHAVIIFTHAASVKPDVYEATLAKRTELIRAEVAKHVGEKVAAAIPSVAVDNLSPQTPDGKPWLGELFTTILERLSDKNAIPLVLALAEDIRPASRKAERQKPSYSGDSYAPRISLDDHQAERVSHKVDRGAVAAGAVAGAAFGAMIGGPVGAGVGALAGAFIGWLSGR